MALIGEMQYLTIGGNTYSIPTSGGSTVSVTRTLTSGTKTATISVDGTSYDLYAPTPNAGTITGVKTTAGAHTTIDVSSGNASFNVPTKTSHLTNDSGFVTTDEKLKTTAAFNGTYFPLFGAATSTAETKYYSGNFRYSKTTSIDSLQLGQVSSSSTSKGRLTLCSGPYYTYLDPPLYSTISANQTYTLPASTGTIALTSDIPTKTSDLTNDAGYLTSYTETDPTVPSWAKASTKPAYTASEVGAQAILVSGTNIKTINNKSLLGSGNISIVNEAEEFTGTRSNAIYRGECFGTYDQNSNSVTLIYHFYNDSDIPTSYTLFTIPEKYRPTTTKYGGAFYAVGSSWISYNGYVTSGGIVKQDVSGSCRSGFGVIKYILN